MDGHEEHDGSDALADRGFGRRDVDDRRPDAPARMSRRRMRLVVSGPKQKQPPYVVRYANLRQPGQGAPLPTTPNFLTWERRPSWERRGPGSAGILACWVSGNDLLTE